MNVLRNNNRRHFELVMLCFLLVGCGGTYDAEKALWKVNKTYHAAIQIPQNAQEKEFSGAIASLQNVVAKYPRWKMSSVLQFRIGMMYAARQDFTSAVNELTKVFMSFPEQQELCARALSAIGTIYEQQGNWKDALSEYNQVIEKYPTTATGLQIPLYIPQYYAKGKMRDKSDHAYEAAVRNYLNLIDMNPYSKMVPLLHSFVVTAYVRQGKPGSAIEILDKFATKYPQSDGAPLALYEIARIYRDILKKSDQAAYYYQRIIDDYPKHKMGKDVQKEMWNLYALSGDSARIQDGFQKAKKRYKDDISMDAAVQLALAVSYDRAGKWDKALEEYRKIIAKYPALPQSLQIPIIIAEHYRREQKTAEAEKALNDGLEQYQKVIQEHSGQEIAIEAQGLTSAIYLMQKKVDAAVRTLVDISQKYPLDGRAPVALLKAGLVCENDLNDISRAAALYTEFITKYPTHRLVSLAQIRLEKITAGQKK